MVKSTPILAAVAVLAGHAAAQPVPAAAPGNNGISGAVFTTVYAPTGYAPNPAMGHGNNLHLYRPDKCPAIGTMPLGFDAPDPRTVCYNGGTDKTGQVNCNIYRSKTDVWLSGGPRGNQPALENGTYFFSILAPGGQADPRDGTISNLSDMCSTTTDRKGNPTLSCPTAGKGNNGANQLVTAISNADGDRWFERMFEVQDGKIVGVGPSVAESMYGAAVTDQSPAPRCTHDYILPSDNLSDGPTAARYGLIRAAHFDDTPNNGGVYILAVCRAPAQFSFNSDSPSPSTAFNPSECKYDAFKVMKGEGSVPDPEPPKAVSVQVDATRFYNQEIEWGITKTVNQPTFHTDRNGNDVSSKVEYTVTVDGKATDEKVYTGRVTGSVTVTNPNVYGLTAGSITVTAGDGSVCNIDEPQPSYDIPAAGEAPAAPIAFTCEGAADSADVTATVSYTVNPNPTPVEITSEPATPTEVFTGNYAYDQVCITDALNYTTSVPETRVGDVKTLGTLRFSNGAVDALLGNTECPTMVTPTVTGPQAIFAFTPADIGGSIVAVSTAVAGCQDEYKNTATVYELAAPYTERAADDATVKVCTPGSVGGHTMGYWQNPNGQYLLTKYCDMSFVDQLRGWRLLEATEVACSGGDMTLAAAVKRTIEVATGDKNNNNGEDMLRGQMLATTLSAHFGSRCSDFVGDSSVKGAPALAWNQEVKLAFPGAYDFSAAFPTIQDSAQISEYITYVANTTNYYAGGSVEIKNLAKDLFDFVNNGWTYDEMTSACPLTL